MRKTIIANTLVKNEERYLWYAVMGIIDYIDKIIIWDTGSTDNTVKIVSEISKLKPGKVDFRQFGEVDINEFTLARQKMLNQSNSDWVMILDGDEVWWKDAIKEATQAIQDEGDKLDSLVNSYYNVVGDIYHHSEESSGDYKIDNHKGYLTIRFINRKIPGLKIAKPHGKQGFYDKEDRLIQDRDKGKRKYLRGKYMHFTNVIRSSSRASDLKVPKRDLKLRYESGITFAKDFYYPEVFFEPRSEIVSPPWLNRTPGYKLKSWLVGPVRQLKRKIVPRKSGY